MRTMTADSPATRPSRPETLDARRTTLTGLAFAIRTGAILGGRALPDGTRSLFNHSSETGQNRAGRVPFWESYQPGGAPGPRL